MDQQQEHDYEHQQSKPITTMLNEAASEHFDDNNPRVVERLIMPSRQQQTRQRRSNRRARAASTSSTSSTSLTGTTRRQSGDNHDTRNKNTQKSFMGLHHRKSPPSKLFRQMNMGHTNSDLQSNHLLCMKQHQRDSIDGTTATGTITGSSTNNTNAHIHDHNGSSPLTGRNSLRRTSNGSVKVNHMSHLQERFMGRQMSTLTSTNKSASLSSRKFDKDVFQILKFGVVVFGTIGLLTIWKMSTDVSLGGMGGYEYYYMSSSSSSFDTTANANGDDPYGYDESGIYNRKDLQKNDDGSNVISNTLSYTMDLEMNRINEQREKESKFIIHGPKPKLSQATTRYLSWKEEERKSFRQQHKARHEQRRDRVHHTVYPSQPSQTNIHVNNNNEYDEVRHTQHHDYYKPYHFDVLNHPSKHNHNHPIINNKQHKSKDTTHIKRSSPCSIAAQKASEKHPHLYPDIHTIHENSVILISGILSRIGFHLALKLVTQCNVKTIIGIDPMLPNTKQHRLQVLDQLHRLYKVIPKLQQNLILPYAGFNPKDVYNQHHVKYMKEESGEIDFSYFEPTHVVHLVSTDEYRLSSVDASDSVYLESNHNDEDGSSIGSGRFGNHIFGLRQCVVGVDHLLSSLINDRNEEDIPIHFTFTSDLDLSVIKDDEDTTINKKRKSTTIRSTAKLMGEIIFRMYNEESMHNDTFVTLRFPNVYGPWGKEGDIDYDLAELAVKHWNDSLSSSSSGSSENRTLLDLYARNKWDGWNQEMIFVDGKTFVFCLKYCYE